MSSLMKPNGPMWQRKKLDWTYDAQKFYARPSYDTMMEEMNDMKMEFFLRGGSVDTWNGNMNNYKWNVKMCDGKHGGRNGSSG